MSIHTASTDANVPENTMISGIVENMDSLLFSLNRIEAHGLKRCNIDCRQITEEDINALQYLNIFMLCARLRGLEPNLVNLTDTTRQTIQALDLRHCYIDEHSRGAGAWRSA